MIRFCHVLKTKVFQVSTFQVFFSKRGYWSASASAGNMPGRDNGTVYAQGETVAQALSQLDDKLQARRDFFQQKINEIDQALFDIRTLGYEAEPLEKE